MSALHAECHGFEPRLPYFSPDFAVASFFNYLCNTLVRRWSSGMMVPSQGIGQGSFPGDAFQVHQKVFLEFIYIGYLFIPEPF